MSVITQEFLKGKQIRKGQAEGVPSEKLQNKFSFLETYLSYAEGQSKEKIVWYLKAILVIPCAIMVPAIILMAMATSSYIWFVAVCMLLFFANVVVHIAEAKSRYFVPLYHGTIALMILIPLVTYLINL